jgi:hypothetical protein
MKRSTCSVLIIASAFAVSPVSAQTPAPSAAASLETVGKTMLRPPFQELGGTQFQNWTGLEVKGGEATLKAPGGAEFQYPNDDSDRANDARFWFDSFGVRFEVRLDDERPLSLDVMLPGGERGDRTAHTLLNGAGWHTVSLPWRNFDFAQADATFLHSVAGLKISANFVDGKPGAITLRRPLLVRAETVWLHADVRGKSVEAGATAEYEVLVGNTTDKPQAVTLSFERKGWEAMTATVEPQAFDLAPGETKAVIARVNVPSRVPVGGHEVQTLRAIGNGTASPSAAIELLTASKMPHPYIMHTADGWAEVREKVKNYDWAKESQREIVEHAEKWNVPNANKPANQKRGDWLFPTQVEHDLMAAGMAYQLTQDNKFAEKVRTFLLRLSDPTSGFPVTQRGCNQASVQEGHFFQHIAMAYDMALPSGVFTDADRAQVEQTLRLFIGEKETSFGTNISNWSVSYLCGQLYCALDLQDLAAASRILYSPGALIDQFVQGTLDDGWWYEVSISYNTWVSSEYSQVALAMRPWGLDLANMRFPSAYRPDKQRVPATTEYGMTDAKWGPIYHNWIGIKRMWDVLPRMVDYRGVMFALNDSTEMRVAGYRGEVAAQPLELAYYLYRDPSYATIIKNTGGKRDLIYGVPELPENTPDPSAASTYADNAGVAVMRSQTQDRPRREQIQAVLHYGDHGWYHGHFDGLDLVHLSRYGRSFYNPEMFWFGYTSYLYKFYVQTSDAHNMVVVDQKMREPAECHRTLFHSGKMMQAVAVDSTTRWSYPPYGGMVYDDQSKSFPEKAFNESRSIPIPKNPPPYAKYGCVTGYTEPVFQRRLMIVTDDYVVLADYAKAEREHTFDSLFQMTGFAGLDAPEKKLLRHTGQWNPDPLGSAQFVTDCDRFEVKAPARSSFHYEFGPGKINVTNQNEPGVLNMDIHTLWPLKHEIMLGTPAESRSVNRQVSYAVRGDGKALTEGKSGIWILGEQYLDVPIEDVKSLELETQTGGTRPGTLFWANARIVTADGKEIPLSQLPLTSENAMQPKEKGKDFEAGPIKIAGIAYSEATSAQPQDGKKPAITKVDLAGVKAARFKAVLGGDYPVGDESQQHKTVAIRSQGKEARFLTVIEPFEDNRMVKRAAASSADTLRVELTDGRVQEIKISNLQQSDGKAVAVQIAETKDGKAIRSETTVPETK